MNFLLVLPLFVEWFVPIVLIGLLQFFYNLFHDATIDEYLENLVIFKHVGVVICSVNTLDDTRAIEDSTRVTLRSRLEEVMCTVSCMRIVMIPHCTLESEEATDFSHFPISTEFWIQFVQHVCKPLFESNCSIIKETLRQIKVEDHFSK